MMPVLELMAWCYGGFLFGVCLSFAIRWYQRR
jgi:hypothetical protein